MFFALFKGETQDLLFIATERYKFCVLQWDAEANEVITRFGSMTMFVNNILIHFFIYKFVYDLCRAMGDVSDRIGRPTDNGQVHVKFIEKEYITL